MSQREPTSIVSASASTPSPTPSLGLGELERLARAIAASGLFGVRTTEQAIALMAIAQAEGMHPALAARDYHIIDGRPALRADAMLARFQRAGGRVKWEAMTADKCAAVFIHPTACPDGVRVEWTMEDARRAGLATRQNWQRYPRAMLRARVISEGIRACYPDPVVGVYTPEEVVDIVADERGDVVVDSPVDSAESALDEWLAAVESAESVEALREIYQRGLEALRDAESRKRFIAAVKSRKAALEADGEVR